MGHYQTFIVRFWSDAADTDMLRGHIQHIASGRGLYFRNMERMIRFMDDHRTSRVNPSLEAGVIEGEAPGNRDLEPIDADPVTKTEEFDVHDP
jgi:hypothetical protein